MIQLGKNPLYVCRESHFIGDVHSEGDKLEKLLSKILPLAPDAHLVFIGDLLDWGNQSLKVLQIVKELKEQYPGQVFVIKGNHELMLMEYLENKVTPFKRYDTWPKHGGFKVLNAFRDTYGIESAPEILAKMKELGYWSIYEELIPYYETKDVFASHAALDDVIIRIHSGFDRAKTQEEKQSSLLGVADKMWEELMWKFSATKRLPMDLGKTLICGHQRVHKRPMLFKDRVFLDCGAGYEDVPLFGVKMPGKVVVSS